MTIRPRLGVTLILKFIIFLIELISCLQYCLYISSATIIPLYFVYYIHRSAALIFRTLYLWLLSATIIPLYFVYYIHRSAALIFRTLYPWLYEVLAPPAWSFGLIRIKLLKALEQGCYLFSEDAFLEELREASIKRWRILQIYDKSTKFSQRLIT